MFLVKILTRFCIDNKLKVSFKHYDIMHIYDTYIEQTRNLDG